MNLLLRSPYTSNPYLWNKLNRVIGLFLLLFTALVLQLKAGTETSAASISPASVSEISAKQEDTSTSIPLTREGWKPGDPLSFGNGLGIVDVQVRERVEMRNNWIDFNSGSNARDGAALLERLRLGLKLNPLENLTLYAQLEDSRTFFDDTNSFAGPPSNNVSAREFVTNDDSITLRQANAEYGNIFGEPVSVKVGRQVLSFGDERLVGGFEWDNNARVFDAAKLQLKKEYYTVDAFAAYVVPHQSNDFDVPATHDLFSGLYLKTDVISDFTSDFYAFWRSKDRYTPSTTFTNNDNQTEGDAVPDGDYVTLGTRWKSKPKALGAWDVLYEGAIQAGTIVDSTNLYTSTTSAIPSAIISGVPVNIGRQNLLAGMAHVEGGYTFQTDWTPRTFASYDFASGTNNPNSGTSNTFQNLYPTNHPLYGIMDRFSLQNIHQATIGVTANPMANLTLRLDYRNTWLVSTNDEWRIANQSALGGAPRYGNALTKNPSNYAGSELNLIATYKVTKWCSLQAGGSHFFAGDYIRDTNVNGETDDANFVYSQVQFDF